MPSKSSHNAAANVWAWCQKHPVIAATVGLAFVLVIVTSFSRPQISILRGESPVFEIENYAINGPLYWHQLPEQVQQDFTLGGTVQVQDWMLNDKPTPGSPSPYGAWSRADIDLIIANATKRLPIGPYPAESSTDLYAALDAYPVKGKRVLVVGTLIPWIEAALQVYGAKEIVTVDFNRVIMDFPGWVSLDVAGLDALGCCFDAIVSYSSLEHDGLGRYGDPLNPFGDLMRMKALRGFIRSGGIFFLSVPMGNDTLAWNAHRIYGPIRFPKLIEGWDLLGIYKDYKLKQVYSLPFGNFSHPLAVIRRP